MLWLKSSHELSFITSMYRVRLPLSACTTKRMNEHLWTSTTTLCIGVLRARVLQYRQPTCFHVDDTTTISDWCWALLYDCTIARTHRTHVILLKLNSIVRFQFVWGGWGEGVSHKYHRPPSRVNYVNREAFDVTCHTPDERFCRQTAFLSCHRREKNGRVSRAPNSFMLLSMPFKGGGNLPNLLQVTERQMHAIAERHFNILFDSVIALLESGTHEPGDTCTYFSCDENKNRCIFNGTSI